MAKETLKDILYELIKGKVDAASRILTEEQKTPTRVEYLNPGSQHVNGMLAVDKACFTPDIAYDAEDITDVLADETAIGFALYQRRPSRKGDREELVAYVLGSRDLEEVHKNDHKTFYLNSAAIIPDLRGGNTGLFPSLMSLFEEAVRQAGYDHVILHAFDDPILTTCYEQLGYRKEHFIKGYYADEDEAVVDNGKNDAWLMRKNIRDQSRVIRSVIDPGIR